ncbi:MAG: response regulator [Candidatus Omnitrophica bacterium]|nr:response regulator [Candidatus Omnitrophota bacterium]
MKHILIVDDDLLIVRTLKRLLSKEKYKVTTALGAEEALNLIKENDFDLIISDIKMPGMDGVEMVKRIRKYLTENEKEPIPEIFITGYAREDIYQDALALKAAAYVEKPFDMKSLLEATRENIKN